MPSDSHYIVVDDILKTVKENRASLVNGEEARKSVDLIQGIYESTRTDKEIHLN
ncbi:hypothetical protein HQN90_07435 [Paenibacillus alba]|nr:hypothetical protein [Paenibacillus alba]